MITGGYKIRDNAGIRFVTFAVIEWMEVFTRKDYRDIVVESLQYCQKEKGLVLHAWCIMSNHLHLVISTVNNNPGDILRDFNKYTSKQIIKAIIAHPAESRKEWMLKIFSEAGIRIVEIVHTSFGSRIIIQLNYTAQALQNRK